jgi:hypothetical protein
VCALYNNFFWQQNFPRVKVTTLLGVLRRNRRNFRYPSFSPSLLRGVLRL